MSSASTQSQHDTEHNDRQKEKRLSPTTPSEKSKGSGCHKKQADHNAGVRPNATRTSVAEVAT